MKQSAHIGRRYGLGIACAVGCAAGLAVRATVLVDVNLVSTGSRQVLDGSTACLSVNLPGATWVVGAGWNWGTPFVSAVWDPPGVPLNVAPLAEEDTAVGVSIASAGGYTKPALLRISASVSMGGTKNNTAGVGFWSAMPVRANGTPSSIDNFTGLIMNEVNGTLQVYSGGALNGSAVSVGTLAEGVTYTLVFDVDTATGAISGVTFDGSAVSGLASTAFTDAATAFAGVLSGGNSRLTLLDLLVEGFEPPPPTGTVLMVN